jgi:hypothetical protein
MNYVQPYALPDGSEEARDEIFAVYDDPADGTVKKWNAPVANNKLGLAASKWLQPFAKSYYLDNVPVNIIEQENYFVFSYQGATADGSDHTATAAEIAAMLAGEVRDLHFNGTEKCATLADTVGTANTPQVKMIRAFKGAAGDTNVQVLARISVDWLLGA